MFVRTTVSALRRKCQTRVTGCGGRLAEVCAVRAVGQGGAVVRLPVPLKHSLQLGLDGRRLGPGLGLVDDQRGARRVQKVIPRPVGCS